MTEPRPAKLHGRAFYESLGSPKLILAPMVDRSEFAWRVLTRSYLDEEKSRSLLAYTPMLHARLFSATPKFRDEHFQPTRSSLETQKTSDQPAWLDGNPRIDRPLFVQFCANKPDELLEAAKYVAPYCDAVDLNLGCPQGIAKSGHYGAFLQEDWETIHSMISKLHNELSIPITAKMRILDSRERTLEYAKMIISAGASILTVHGRRREQKGHNMGVADWSMIRYLRDNLPPDTVLFANGNILNAADIDHCLSVTGADGVMSAEGNLSDPTVFASPPSDPSNREYWRGHDGIGGYRIDGVIRRYMDIIHRYVLDQEPPQRPPLYVPGDDSSSSTTSSSNTSSTTESQPQSYETLIEIQNKKRKRDKLATSSPNLRVMQGHLFQILRPMINTHTEIRDALARTKAGDIAGFENVLGMIEEAVRKGLDEEEAALSKEIKRDAAEEDVNGEMMTPSERTIAKYKRPWWVCQPYIRPLPEEAVRKGAMTLSKKEMERLGSGGQMNGRLEREREREKEIEIPVSKEELVCG